MTTSEELEDLAEWQDTVLYPYLEQVVDLLYRTIQVFTELQRENDWRLEYLSGMLTDHINDADRHPSQILFNAKINDFEQRVDGKQAFLHKQRSRSKYD